MNNYSYSKFIAEQFVLENHGVVLRVNFIHKDNIFYSIDDHSLNESINFNNIKMKKNIKDIWNQKIIEYKEEIIDLLSAIGDNDDQFIYRWGDLPVLGSILNIFDIEIKKLQKTQYFHESHNVIVGKKSIFK